MQAVYRRARTSARFRVRVHFFTGEWLFCAFCIVVVLRKVLYIQTNDNSWSSATEWCYQSWICDVIRIKISSNESPVQVSNVNFRTAVSYNDCGWQWTSKGVAQTGSSWNTGNCNVVVVEFTDVKALWIGNYNDVKSNIAVGYCVLGISFSITPNQSRFYE